MEQLVGQVLHNRYRIQSLLGRQTGRRTFLASDTQTGTLVVIKLLLFGPDFVWDDLKLFEREVEVLQSLERPDIPKYIDSFEVETELGKGFALVQTYIQAKSLQDWIESGRTFSESDIKAIAKELLEILDYLHSRQPPIVHRDIKPSNILLSDRTGNSLGKIFLIDFGSVQTVVHNGTRTIVGTYGYMPPEQFGGQTVSASDLYALGLTLIYLTTGQHPDRLPQKEMRVLFEDKVNLSPSLIHWLKCITQPSLDLRFQSAKQALEALLTSNLQVNPSSITTQPVGSRVRVTNTGEMLEVLIPPRGFHLGLIPIIGFAIVWNSFLINWYSNALRHWGAGGWFAALFAICHVGVGLYLIWQIFFTLLGRVRLCITQLQISLTYEILGFKLPLAQTANRENLTKVELTRLSYKKDSKGNQVAVPPQINIWAVTKKFELGRDGWLTEPELEWLAQNLSSWLQLTVVMPN